MAKQAILSSITDINGNPQPVFLDSETGEPVSDFTGYEVVTEPSDVQKQDLEEVLEKRAQKRGDRSSDFFDGKEGPPRSSSNNFGYIKNPTALKLAGFVPGPIGAVSRVGSTLLNANNIGAVNEARKKLDLPELSNKEVVKGFLSDRKGYVGDVKIGDTSYAVSLDTAFAPGIKDEKGKTGPRRSTLTFNEAVRRQEARKSFEEYAAEYANKVYAAPVDAVERKALDDVEDTPSITDQLREQQPTNAERPKGLAALAPNGLNFRHPEQEENVSPRVKDALSGVMTEMNKSFDVTSGYRSPDYNKSVGGAPKSLHTQGLALDIDMKGMSDDEKKSLVSELTQRGFRGFITYSDSPNMLHVDMRNLEEPHFMFDRTSRNMQKAQSWFQEIAETKGLNFPSQITSTPYSSEQADAIAETQDNSIQRTSLANIEGMGKQNISVPFDGFNPYTATPAQYAHMGFMTPDEKTMETIGKTLSGELSGDTLRTLQKNDPNDPKLPEAQKEAANIMATMANRAAQNDLGWGGVLTGVGNYDSLKESKSKVTLSNFNQFQDTIMNDVVPGFFSNDPRFTPTDFGVTHSFSTSMKNPPGWATDKAVQTGQHFFDKGIAPYNFQSYSEDYYSQNKEIANAINSVTPQGYSGSFGSFGRTDTPSSATQGYKDLPSQTPTNNIQSAQTTQTSQSTQNFGRQDTPSSGRKGFNSPTVANTLQKDLGEFDTISSQEKAIKETIEKAEPDTDIDVDTDTSDSDTSADIDNDLDVSISSDKEKDKDKDTGSKGFGVGLY